MWKDRSPTESIEDDVHEERMSHGLPFTSMGRIYPDAPATHHDDFSYVRQVELNRVCRTHGASYGRIKALDKSH